MKTNWPPELVRSIAARRCVLFFGAGVSMNSTARIGSKRPIGWSDFLHGATKTLGRPNSRLVKEVKILIEKNDFLTAAEVIKQKVGRERFVDLVKDEFHTPDFQPAKIHDVLFQLDLKIALTPNFDCIYETAAGKRGAGTITVKKYDDDDIADALRRDEPVLIKTHGTVTHPNHLIFTRTDYAKARSEHKHFYELINALLRTHTFLFVGCGLDDPDIRALLEDYRYTHPFGQSHYFVTAAGLFEPVKAVLSDTLKINIVEYEASAGHMNLTPELDRLVALVDAERDEMAATQSW